MPSVLVKGDTVFTASNGVKVLTLKGGIGFQLPMQNVSTNGINAEKVAAIREFFQAERDEELGRWRNPANPNEIVYRNGDHCVLVVDKRTGRGEQFTRWEADLLGRGAAFEYFRAHPERKPWEDAKPGEIWVLTLEGDEVAYQCMTSFSGHVYFGGADDTIELNSTMITAARRIWPESF